jgi:cytoskeleton protein RodZ
VGGGVGEELRQARVSRGIELADVAAETKIKARFLAALEAEEWGTLPDSYYAAAFLRRYADYLGLDGADLAARFRRSQGSVTLGSRPPSPIVPAGTSRRSQRLPAPSPQLLVVLGALVVGAAIVVVLILTLGGGSNQVRSPQHEAARGPRQGSNAAPGAKPEEHGAKLMLTASAEVWVCLLDANGKPLIDGQILSAGSRRGPYRSGRFELSLGNGGVEVTLAGRPVAIAPTPNPVGFSLSDNGELRELPEAERPTCT